MRRHFAVVTLLLLLFAVSAVAQERTEGLQKGNLRVFAFGSNLSYTESDAVEANWRGGYGLGLEYQLNERWSAELSVSREQAGTWTVGMIGPDGVFQARNYKITAHPIDVVGQYHFFTKSAWKPFVGIGARYVDSKGPGFPYQIENTQLAPQITGGVYYNFTKNLGLRLDVKRLLANGSSYFDDERKVSVGLGWKF